MIFDEVVSAEFAGERRDLVIHRDSEGEIIVYHSPLTGVAIKCGICAGGARVYVREKA
jgi:hypothetical protein